ncbi:hypothetical protein [Alkaliphilus transvaalensis]|uniref:hypothetical protein n=1 Tax=Alkaliphilus transvaalensis TaxID=114628 RepID=UPI000479321E|nr:hypothetical protein [Alkaliphilus transvaalensis]
MSEGITNFLDTYNLPWLILAVICWVVIFFTCSLKEFKRALPIALWTMVVGGVLENFFIDNKFWKEDFILVHLGELDLFVVIGPFFTIGLFLIRCLPKKSWQKLFLVLLLSTLATLIEFFSIKLGFLSYDSEKWGYIYSIVAYIIGLMSALGFYFIYYDREYKFKVR